MAGIKLDLAYTNRTITRPGLLFNRIIHRSIPQTLAREAAISSALGETKVSVKNSRIILETGGAEKCLGQMTAARMLQKAGIASITIPKGMKKVEIGTDLHAVMSRWPGATARILGEAEGKPGRMFLPEEMKQGRVFESAKNGSVMDLYRLIRDGCSPDKLENIDLSKLTGHKPFFLANWFGRTELSPFYWIAGHPNTPAPILLHLACSGDGYALEAYEKLKDKSTSEWLDKLADSSSLAVREAVIKHAKTSIDTLVKLARSPEGYAVKAYEKLDLKLLTPAQITLLASGNSPKVLEKLADQLRAAGILEGDVEPGKLGEYVFNYFTVHFTGQDLNALFTKELFPEKLAEHPNTDKKDLIGLVKLGGKQPKDAFKTKANLSFDEIERMALSAFDNATMRKIIDADDLEDIAMHSSSQLIRLEVVNHPSVSLRAKLTIASGADQSAVAALEMLDLSKLPAKGLLFLLCSQSESVQEAVVSHIRTDGRFVGIDTNTDVADEMASRLLKSTPISIARARKLFAHATKMTRLRDALKAYIREFAITSVSGNATFEQALDDAMLFGRPAASAYNAIKEAKMLSAEVLMYLSFSPIPFVSSKAVTMLKKCAVDQAVASSKVPNIKKDIEEKLVHAFGDDKKKAVNAIKWLKKNGLLTPNIVAYLQLNNMPYLAMENLTGF